MPRPQFLPRREGTAFRALAAGLTALLVVTSLPLAAVRAISTESAEPGLGVIVVLRDRMTLAEADPRLDGLSVTRDLGGGMLLLEDLDRERTLPEYIELATRLHDSALFELAAANSHSVQPMSAGVAPSSVALDDPDATLATGASYSQDGAPWHLDIIDGAADGVYSVGPTGKGVYVYVIDTGIDPTHADFNGRVLEIPGSDIVDGDDLPRPCQAEYISLPGGGVRVTNSHGHHVASIAAGFRYGVAKEATIVPLRVFGCTGGATEADILTALELAKTHNASLGSPPAVVNMSLGGPCGGDCSIEASSYATKVGELVDAGIAVVIAAGNDGEESGDERYACNLRPAFLGGGDVNGVVTVGNSTVSDARNTSSSYGECVDIYAPGTGITAADHRSRTSAIPIMGTSMAAPMVAGAVALYLSENPQIAPEYRPLAAEQFLLDNAAAFVSDKAADGDADKRLKLPARWTNNFSVVDGTGNIRLTFAQDVTGLEAGDITLTGTASGCTPTVTTVTAAVYDVSVTCTGDGHLIAELTADAVELADTSDVGPGSAPTAVAVQPDGKILLGGVDSYNGVAVNGLVRIKVDGTLDDTFDVGVGPNDLVQSIAVQSDGKILVGGDFTNFDGAPAPKMARLESDGSVDVGFDVGTGPGSGPMAMLPLDSGKILVGGLFSTFDGVNRDGIILLQSDGTVDPSFTLAPTGYGTVNGFLELSDGRILIYGNFDDFGGSTTDDVAILETDLTLDTSFSLQDATDQVFGDNTKVWRALEQTDGNILLAGSGTYPLDGTLVDWGLKNFVGRVTGTGSVDPGFTEAVGEYNVGLRTDIALLGDDTVLWGGAFDEVNGTATTRLVVLDTDGELLDDIDVDDSVRSINAHSTGFVIAGSFTAYDGASRARLVLVDESAELVPGFLRTTAPSGDLQLPTLTFDSTAPAVSSGPTAVTSGSGKVTFEIDFVEAVRTQVAGNFAVTGSATGCSVSKVEGAGKYYLVDVACTGNGTVILTASANSSKDLAGNTGPGAAASSVAYSLSSVSGTTTTTTPGSSSGSSTTPTTVPAASAGAETVPVSPTTTAPVRTTIPATPVSTLPAAPGQVSPKPVPTTLVAQRTEGALAGSTLSVGERRIGGTLETAKPQKLVIEVRNRKGRIVRKLSVNTAASGDFTLFLPKGIYSVTVRQATTGSARNLWNVRSVKVG
jgi:uncharacterized delta-60 repeat protein